MKIIFYILFLLIGFQGKSIDLVRYTCLVNRVDVDGFAEERTFDKEGIILTKNKYNPLVIVQYGVLSYYAFQDTKDSVYYYNCLKQAAYFKDDSKVDVLFKGKGIGLPYDFNYKDMTAPWYSGMTQGYAASFLLRYYNLTKDETILPIIEKVIFVLIARQEDGGTLSTTREGHKWLQEYPNSKKSPEVLNGAINGLIGLKEYCDFFNKDEHAKEILEQVYEGIVNSLTLYDTPDWTYYNRKKHKISPLYIRYQFHEMMQLYNMFGDHIFDHQMRIWGMMSYGRDMKTKLQMYKLKDLELCAPVKKTEDGFYRYPIDSLTKLDVRNFEISTYKSLKHLKKKKELKSFKTSKSHFFKFDFQSDSVAYIVNYLEFKVSDFDQIEHINIYQQSNGKFESISFKYHKFADKYQLLFDPINLKDLVISIDHFKKRKSELSNLKFYNTSSIQQPFIGYYKADTLMLHADIPYKINLPQENTKRAVILYRHSTEVDNIKKSKWSAKNYLEKEFTPKFKGYYEFAVIFDLDNPLSTVGRLEVLKR